MSDDPLKPGGALEGPLFRRFLDRLSEAREPEIDERIGAWRIVRELGRGGSGVVFLAERADGAYDQQVALKWLRSDRPVPGGREVLARERELLASLDHPNIARLIDGGETDDGMRWFAMDLVPGETIDRAAAHLDRRARAQLVGTLCWAVHHAHRRGLIHGDIKPSNVLVDDSGRPRLVDFGISRLRRAGPGSSYGMTPDYASPEQREGAELTTASDIWQLGRLLEDLLDTEAPAPDTDAIIQRATRDAPEERYASASAMAADIEAWLAARPVAARNGGLIYRLSRLVKRNRALSAVTVLALVVIVGGGAWMTWQLALERDRARNQAARAEAALADTEAALARAEALGDFLVDLLGATRPDRPRDELPTTAEILDRGAERAMDPDSAPPAERLDMLRTIGDVYRARGRYHDAEPLLTAAADLAREHDALSPVDRARALEQRGRLMIAAGDPLDDAESVLIEAESALAEAPQAWEALIRVRVTRTWVERHRGRHDLALDLVQSLWRSMPPSADVAASSRAGLFDSLAGLHHANGHLDRAAQFRDWSLQAFRQLPAGEQGQGYVVSLANSVGLERTRGEFEKAERRARRAIELYDHIYPEPVDYRAAVHRSLARVLLAIGKVDAAFQSLADYGAEYALLTGREPGQWPLYYSQRGYFRIRLGEIEAAVADIRQARDMLREQGGFDRLVIDSVDLILAGALCRSGAAQAGESLLEGLSTTDSLAAKPRTAAQLFEARAACALATERPEAALGAIERSLSLQEAPGLLVHTADRRLLEARILAQLGRDGEARAALDRTDRRFVDLGLADHPVRARLQRFSMD
ncbi:MAG: protein kinase [Gammaproteobacteria bacterium]|nr:protein kinase [Gammaproteobacteria bacterium]